MIKVYYANVNELADEAVFNEQLKRVRSARQHKVLHCKHREDQIRSLMAGLLIRHAVEQELLSYENLEYEENSHGKILLKCEAFPVWISISHSGDFAAVAISNHKVGIDIQQQREMKSQERMMQMCYSEEEKGSGESFFYHWTRKEAYSKMLGLGMQLDFKTIDTMQSEKYWTKRIEGDYWMSVASSHDIKELDISFIHMQDI